MQIGAITGYIDVAQLTLYVFWGFFAGLVIYLHRENKREGYPLINSRTGEVVAEGFPPVPAPKAFHLHDGTVRYAPRDEAFVEANGTASDNFPGAPLDPVGNPMLANMGPGAWADRPDVPDVAFDDGLPKIVPLRAAGDFFLAWEDPDPRDMSVVGADGVIAGKISDCWVDRSEVLIRYLEITLDPAFGGRNVLLPMNFGDIKKSRGEVHVSFILGAQFSDVPATKSPESVTLLEEEKIMAYYAAGILYATPDRLKPLL
jgi:photosynthetic reaction center H subunit